MRTIVHINEEFVLSFTVSNYQVDIIKAIVRKLIPDGTEFTTSAARGILGFTEFRVPVANIRSAVKLIDNVDTNFAMIAEANKDWNIGLYAPDEYTHILSKYMNPVVKIG